MTPSTPEGPAATREPAAVCGVCWQPPLLCPRRFHDEAACYLLGYVRVSARLVEVERERGEFMESLAKVGEDAFRWQAERDTAQDALAAAESRASAAEQEVVLLKKRLGAAGEHKEEGSDG